MNDHASPLIPSENRLICRFLPHENKFRFVSTNDSYNWTIRLFGTAYKLLGFDDLPEIGGTTTFDSTRSIDPQPVHCINVHLDDVSPLGNANMAAVDGTLRPTTSLLTLLIGPDVKPFDNVVYRAPADGLHGVDVSDKALDELHLRVTEVDDAPLTAMPEHTLVLEVQTIETADVAADALTDVKDQLARLVDLTQLLLLDRTLNK
eukprot:jgi/Chrzof1/1458/Cz10g08200.t1